MRIVGKIILPLILIVGMSASCNSFTSPSRANPTADSETAMAMVWTKAAETQSAFFTSTPSPIPLGSPINITKPYAIITPKPDQQVYVDPDGWYSIIFPDDMKPSDKPNSFSRSEGLFETGYLPEMGYMSNVRNVCAWLANVDLKQEGSVIDQYSLEGIQAYPHLPCSVSTKAGGWYSLNYAIYENPGVEPQHRFIYVKTAWSYPLSKHVATYLSWLKPVNEKRYESDLAPLSPEEISLWESIAPSLRDVSITEYALPPKAQAGPSEEMLLNFVPTEMLPNWSAIRKNTPDEKPTKEEQLESLGYELKVVGAEPTYRQQLLRDGRLLFDYVAAVSDVYTFSTDSGPITAFIVETIDRRSQGEYHNSFLIQNDSINAWSFNNQDPPFAPILSQGEPLWLKTSKDRNYVQIIKSNREVIYSFVPYTEPLYSVDKFVAWNGHWILAARDFLIQDGEIINEKLGFQEIFSWSLVDDKPIYLFRKGPRIGFSYDGKILPLQYQDVAHHLCCGFASNNPYIGNDSLHFFGKRNGVWYYVVVKFKRF